MTTTIHPVILCGGSGTRLWPLSTPEHPKQFLSLTSSRSMIEETASRVESAGCDAMKFTSPLIVGSKRHQSLLEAKLPDAQKILEPFGRNSAPAIAAACLTKALDDLILILPADHDIRDIAAFHAAIATAASVAEQGDIVTFGIRPTHPATGYGYIKAIPAGSTESVLPVEEFVEKPDLKTAQQYLASGSYFWNAGIFLFTAATMLDALQAHAPEVIHNVKQALPDLQESDIVLDDEAFAATPSISIDYAVMEKATNVKTIPVSMGWSDVGGYRALHDLLTTTDTANYTSGPVHIQNATGNYVRSEGPAIAVNGVSNLAIVATPGEVMITPLEDDAAVKSLGAAVQNHRPALGLSQELVTKTRDWLWQAFELWSKVGWDDERSGFVEQLTLDGEPDALADRRVRVQARQVFSFAKAIEMGWPDRDAAKALVDKGLHYIDTRLRHANGGWVHMVAADGRVIDDRRDLYDHAFMILAGATAYQVTGSGLGLKIADDAIAFIDAELKDNEYGGWFESSERETPRRANPHMHLLEAMMAYHQATGCDEALSRAAEIVRLFETRFFNPANDVMAEFFTEDWRNESSDAETIFEPGHHYEWATLLHQYEAITDHDTGSWRRRLIRRADATGLNPKTGFALNSVRANGEIVNAGSRLWHQLERYRTNFLHTELVSPEPNERFAEIVFERFLDQGAEGGWLDELDSHGTAASKAVPASMLYHMIGALESMMF